jgi:aminoglycoside phosphotransferase (APT) family kinase protein
MMSDPGPRLDRRALEPEWQQAFAWVEETLGGRLVTWERHPRWRPAWFLTLERGGEVMPLYWRGARGALDHGIYDLAHEAKILGVLERNGIPVPHVYGHCMEPEGLLLQGMPGRANLATAESQSEREAVLDDYVSILARMHAIDPAEFEAIGLERPRTPEALGLGDFEAWERQFRQEKRGPDAMTEFGVRWIRRNTPRDRHRATFIHGDTGQFLFEQSHVTSVIDLELAYLGDPAADFGGLRSRDLSEPLGDLDRALRHYESITGEEMDLEAVDYHTFRFGWVNPMCTGHLCVDPPVTTNYVQYLAWYTVYSRCPLEVLARMKGIALEPPSLPEADATPRHPAIGHLVDALDPERGGDDPDRRYELDRLYRVAQYLERADRYGAALDADNLDDMAAILGHRPRDGRTGEAELERFVLEAGPEHDPQLVRFFHRRLLRQEALLRPALRELLDVEMPPLSRA